MVVVDSAINCTDDVFCFCFFNCIMGTGDGLNPLQLYV